MTAIRLLIVIGLIANLKSNSSAQVIIEALPRFQVGMHLNYLMPDEPVNLFVTDNEFGYQFEIQYRVQYNKPFLAGAYYNEFTLSKYVLKYVQPSGTGDIDVREKANTRRLEAGFSAGFYPEINWLLQPYMVGRFGAAIFQTSSILIDDDTDESLERISEHTSLTPAYGLDLGIHIVPNIWYLRGDVRFGYIGNVSTSFMLLDEDEAGTTGIPIDYFETVESAGKWWKLSVGVSYMF